MATPSLPKMMKALTLASGSASIRSIALPPIRPTYLLIKVHSVALNPTDWKHVAGKRGAEPFSIVGCDFAGTIVSIGGKVTKSFKVGEKVFGCAHGCNSSEKYDGVFAEYAAVKGDLAMKVPDSVKLEEASTIGLGSITVGQGLFQKGKGIGLEFPNEGKGNNEWVLVYGGSTATGTLGIQFAKQAGYKVVTTCSPRNNELVKSRGADEVVDYHDPQAPSKIRELTGNKLKYAWDTKGDDDSAKFCGEALSSEAGGYFGTILSNRVPRDDLTQTGTLMYTVFNEGFDKFGMNIPASEADFEFGKKWMALTEKLLAEGALKPHPAKVGSGGLEGVLNGMDDMKNGKVSGVKLVYNFEG
ncbi:chaperonin 10-like protein [Amylocarpus encephaloides]|uniref:Chaperonin 10-like protein n=1 Tax=Amylocarpus encephaloides TaxID=45428 RepID=A0A9P8C9K6_9HELO|nr:chaperonin 10-like protein [Amylocarpus encephaloides]